MEEVKLHGHIISRDGIYIYPSRVEAIQQLDFSRNNKEIQSFNGKINFLRRFIPNLTKHLWEITNMLKKISGVKWSEDDTKSFNLVKFFFVPYTNFDHPWLYYGFHYFFIFFWAHIGYCPNA